jgi:hypothetical protein
MKTKDLIKELAECKTADQLIDLQKQLPGYNVGFDFTSGKAFVTIDSRKQIKEALYKEGLTIKDLAEAVDYEYGNMKSFLAGLRALPYEISERVRAVLGL